jgi:DNA polymerase
MINECSLCQELVRSRKQIVPGVGNSKAKLMIIGEAPGQEEDTKGEPFVGRSGRLLNATLAKLGVKREDVYITNIVKCRPPNNRKPFSQEVKRCEKYLHKEIGMITPRVIVTLGLSATEVIYEGGLTMGEVNGKPLTLGSGIVVVPVYHPSAVLRNPNLRESFERALKISIEESKKP